MKTNQLSNATLSELVNAYTEAAQIHGQAIEKGAHTKGNKAADRAFAIYAELKRRGLEAQRALLPLLNDPDPGVRLWSATHALEFSPTDAEPVLENLIPLGKSIGLSAERGLEMWRKGELKFP